MISTAGRWNSLVALPPRGRGTVTWGTRPTTELQNRCVVEAHWNDAPQQVRALYTKRIRTQHQVPSHISLTWKQADPCKHTPTTASWQRGASAAAGVKA
jgi:hypothetical protein